MIDEMKKISAKDSDSWNAYWSKVIETVSNRLEYLQNRIRFLDGLPKRRYGDGFPNTLPYKATFQEMDDLKDVLGEIRIVLDRYISDTCPVCSEIIKFDPYEGHHISYFPELVTPVHTTCHNEIHKKNTPYSHLKPPDGDGVKFYRKEKIPDRWLPSGIKGNVLKTRYRATASIYPPPNLNWNRAALTQVFSEYIITWEKR